MMGLLENKYEIQDTIGQGGFGIVLKVKEKTTQKYFAAKCIFIRGLPEKDILGIEKEINLLIQFDCKYSVKYIESFKDDNYYYIILELCDSDLDMEIKRHNGFFSIEKIKKILTQLNDVFTLMKIKHIVHRDIKPQNILIKYTNNEKTDFDVKLTDYGISKRLTTTQRTTNRKGYINTQAPEVLNEEDYDEKADLWSLGVVIYYLCLKKWPFDGTKDKEIEKKILSGVLPQEMPNSPLIADLIINLLQVECNKRFNWDQYLNHPFFKNESENNSIIQNVREIDLSKEDDLYNEIRTKINIYEISNTELKNIIQSDKRLRPSKIMEYVNSHDNEISMIGLLLLIKNYFNFFNRPFIEKFFYFKNIDETFIIAGEVNTKDWDIKIYNNKYISISESEKIMLNQIIDAIFNNFNYILSEYKKEDILTGSNITEKEKDCFIFYVDSLFEILCNIYDLNSNFCKLFFENKWINLYLKLFEFYIDFNNLPEVIFGRGDDYIHLEKFIKLFNLCMGNDVDFSQRIKLIQNYKDLLLKILIISTFTSNICCCYHGFGIKTVTCHKAIDTILKALLYIEKNNDSIYLENEQYIKIKYTDFLSKKYDKNVCIVHLNKMAEVLSNKDIFKYLIEETDLFISMVNKEATKVHHCIDELENFVNLCEYPKSLLKVLKNENFKEHLNNREMRAYKRIYREILKKILSNSQSDFIEEEIYKNHTLINLLLRIDLIEVEGIFDVLLNPDSPYRIDIFYRNPIIIGEKFLEIANNLHWFEQLKINAVFRIMNRFLLIGQKIKEKYNIENYYVNELKNAFQSFKGNDSDEYKELKKYFEN